MTEDVQEHKTSIEKLSSDLEIMKNENNALKIEIDSTKILSKSYKKQIYDLKKEHTAQQEKYAKEIEDLREYKDKKIKEEREKRKSEKKIKKKNKKLDEKIEAKTLESFEQEKIIVDEKRK